MNMILRQRQPFHAWQFGHPILRSHIDPCNAAGLAHGIAGYPRLFLQRREIVGRNDVRNINAFAVNVEFPAVIDAADATLLVAAKEQRRQLVRAIGPYDADLSLAIAKRH
jgi:hypothetical protein